MEEALHSESEEALTTKLRISTIPTSQPWPDPIAPNVTDRLLPTVLKTMVSECLRPVEMDNTCQKSSDTRLMLSVKKKLSMERCLSTTSNSTTSSKPTQQWPNAQLT